MHRDCREGMLYSSEDQRPLSTQSWTVHTFSGLWPLRIAMKQHKQTTSTKRSCLKAIGIFESIPCYLLTFTKLGEMLQAQCSVWKMQSGGNTAVSVDVNKLPRYFLLSQRRHFTTIFQTKACKTIALEVSFASSI